MENCKSECIFYPELKIPHCCLAESGAHDRYVPFWEDASNGWCSPADHALRVGSATDLSIVVLKEKIKMKEEGVLSKCLVWEVLVTVGR